MLTLHDVIEAHDVDIPGISSSIQPLYHTLQEAKKTTLEQFEKIYLTNLLTHYQGNVTHAAHAAGKERRSFQRLLRKYALDRTAFSTSH